MIRTRVTSIAMLLALSAQAAHAGDAIVATRVSGSVTYHLGDGAPAEINGPIGFPPNAVITTGPKSLAKLLYPESTNVIVGEESAARFGAAGNQASSSTIILSSGALLVDVKHPAEESDYVILTPLAQIAVKNGVTIIWERTLDTEVMRISGQKIPVSSGGVHYIEAGKTLRISPDKTEILDNKSVTDPAFTQFNNI